MVSRSVWQQQNAKARKTKLLFLDICTLLSLFLWAFLINYITFLGI